MLPQWSPQAMANIIFTHQVRSRVHGEGETFVMVEGKTDEVLWEEFRSREDCTIYPVDGKDRVVDTLDIVKKRDSSGVAGIVDADYWLITDADELGTDNLLYDDCCPDMEMILLCSPALKKVLRHELPEDIDAAHNFAELLSRESKSLAAEYGYFRLLNHLNAYGLKCNAIPLSEVIDIDSLELDAKLLAARLTGGRPDILSDDLLRQVADLRQRYSPDNIQLCRGKDVIAILAHILPALYEARFGEVLPDSAREIFQAKRLAKELRKAYEYIYFKDSSLFGCIQNWENTNSPYKILKS